MKFIISTIAGFLLFHCCYASNFSGICFNKKFEQMAKEVVQPYEKQFCTSKVKPAHIIWAINTAMPRIMNKNFLGVEPPPNWQLLALTITNECFQKGDLCSKDAREDFSQCAIVMLPIILMQLGPWINDNCEAVNTHLFSHWNENAVILKQLTNDFLQEVNKARD